MIKTIENTSFRMKVSVAIGILVFLIGGVLAIGQWKQSTDNSIEVLKITVGEHTDQINSLELADVDVRIHMAETNLKLASIEMSLIEIKEALKNGS